MCKKIFITFLAIVASVGTLSAGSGTCGANLTWNLTGGVLTISGTGSMTNFKMFESPWHSYRSNIKSVTIVDGVTSIGTYAFYDCYCLRRVTIGNSVTSIGEEAFSACSSLTSVTIPNSVTSIGKSAFLNCSNLKSIEIPNSVTSIGNYAFTNCSNLTSIEIPNSVTSIGNYAFSGCSSLTSVTIPNSVTSIGEEAFSACSSLTSVTIPNSVTSIGNFAFYGCSGLTNVVWNAKNCQDFSSDITPFYCYKYYDLRNQIMSFVFGEEVEHIPAYLCAQMNNLTSIEIPNSVTSIGYEAFYNCTGLTSVHISDIAAWCKIAFSDYGANPLCYAHHLYLNDTEITDLVIPNGVTSIGDYAFYNCSGMTSINIPNSVTSIGDEAFNGCSSLNRVYCELGAPFSITNIFYSSSPTIYIPNCAFPAFSVAPTWKDMALAPVSVNLAVMNNTGGVVVENCGQMEIEAIPFVGYQFKRWQDGNKDNPRKYTLTQSNRNFIAEFELDKHQITLDFEANQGNIIGDKGKFNYGTEHTIEAVPNYGYHFTQWSDGETENPRTFVLEQDTTFIAEFAPNQYSLTIQYDKAYGEVDAEQGKFDYLSEHTIEANANYGYHFSSWSDGVTDNPRTLILTKDTTLIATFAPNKYQLELIADATMGAIEGEQGEFDYLSEKTFEAVPNNGYQFTGWSDGVTDNPRTITLTCDTTFTALFEYNMHEVTVLCNPEQGSVEKSGETYHTAECTISATPNYGYHFVQWNDGETDNPRTFVVTQDTTFTAEFAKNVYKIEKIADAEQGRIEGPLEAEYLTEVSLEAIPNEYRQFVQWSDGNTDNPRTIILTQDTTFAAQFDLIHYPVIFLDYNGAVLSEQSVAHNSAATAPEVAEREGYRFIGWSADIEHITASTFVIALYEKKGINITYKGTEGEIIASEEVDIHIPDAPIIEGSTFAGWLTEAANNSEGIILRATYTIDHPTVNEDVTIEPGSTTAGVSFPYITGTLTYVLVVRDLFGFVICKIMFNATGHLLGVAFAPGHKSAQQAQTEGFQFTVEGLTPSTTYEYEFVAHDETDAVIEKLAGSFTTTEDVTTEITNSEQSNAPQKILHEGIMYILKNGEKYNAQGARVE